MADVFSGKAGRNAAIWTAGKAQEQLDQVKAIYGDAKSQAGGYLSNAYNQGNGYLATAFKGGQADLTKGGQQATQYLQTGMQGALDANNQGFGTARTDITTARDAALGHLTGPGGATDVTRQGYGDALASLKALYGQATGTQQQAADAWNPLVAKGMAGYDMLNNALGLNGAGGTTAARDAFTAGPGYEWQVDQATSAAQRAANRVGGASGGNAMDAVTRLSSNLANQEFGSWIDNLKGYQGAATTAVQGRAGALSGLAELYANQGTQTAGLQQSQGRDLASILGSAAGVETTAGQNMADLASKQGTTNAGIIQTGNTALATNATNQAQLLANLKQLYGQNRTNLATSYGSAQAGLETGTAQGVADATNNYWNTTLQAGQQGMMAGQQAAANRFGAMMGGLQLAGQAIGGMAGLPTAGGGSVGGGFLSSLFPK